MKKKKSTNKFKAKKGKHLKRRSSDIFKTKRNIPYNVILKVLFIIALCIIIYNMITTKDDLKEINNRLNDVITVIDKTQTEQNTLPEKTNTIRRKYENIRNIKSRKESRGRKTFKRKGRSRRESKTKQEAIKVAQAKTQVTSRGGTTARSSSTVTYSLNEYQAYAKDLCINTYGWTENDFQCLVKLWNRESGWNPNAHNKSSGAHGIPQSLPASKMASEGADYYTNGKTQIRWGLKYIKGRYGSPSAAWAHSQSKGWY